jgi:hypothetical protein
VQSTWLPVSLCMLVLAILSTYLLQYQVALELEIVSVLC